MDAAQRLVLHGALGEKIDGNWSAFEVGVVMSRQNGKGAIIEARELAGLFLFGERLILHSAHQFDTALEAFRRILFLIESTPDLDARVMRVSRSHGEEGIELKGGQRLRFKARTRAGGRGFSGDCVILDEAMILPDEAIGALMPTMSARPNPQLWYLGSAVDKEVHEHGRVFSRIRGRGVKGDDPSLAFFEWSMTPGESVADQLQQVQANPGATAVPPRISLEHIARERASMSARTFYVERMSGEDYWYTEEDESDRTIDPLLWAALTDLAPSKPSRPVFGVALSKDQTSASIAAVGAGGDGLPLLSVVDARPGTGWVVDRLKDLAAKVDAPVALDTGGPAGSLLRDLDEARVRTIRLVQGDYAQACGALLNDINSRTVRHVGDDALNDAVRTAKTRPLGERWAWARKTGDITPLEAATVALHGFRTRPSVQLWGFYG